MGRIAVPADLPDIWRPLELKVVSGALDARALDAVDGALTGCALAIAETGTIILDGGARQGARALSLVPDYHLCIVEEQQIVGTVPEAIGRVAASVRRMNTRDLNDNAVQVIVNGKERYFDPGTAFTPYGEMPWQTTMAPGLKLNKDGGSWVQAPLAESEESRTERKADLRLDNEGTLQGKLTVTYYGSEAQILRMRRTLRRKSSLPFIAMTMSV